MTRMHALALTAALLLGGSFSPAGDKDKDKLFVATPFTAVNSFTAGIEGPACDAAGNIYAVNFARQQTIGIVTPDGKAKSSWNCQARAPATASFSTRKA